MQKYKCIVCDWIYDPEVGDPESGIEPGTAFEDIPEDWVCPLCGASKADFEAAYLPIIMFAGSLFKRLPAFFVFLTQVRS